MFEDRGQCSILGQEQEWILNPGIGRAAREACFPGAETFSRGAREPLGTPQGKNQGNRSPVLTLLPPPISCQHNQLLQGKETCRQGPYRLAVQDPERGGEDGVHLQGNTQSSAGTSRGVAPPCPML